MINRLKSWPLWIAISALIVFVTMQTTGVDISEPVNALMGLFLPLLVAFGIINDPIVHDRLFANGEQKWYESWGVWTAFAALIVYCAKLFFNLDISPTVNGFMDVLLPVISGLGVVKSPTTKGAL
jgi:uncharacterized membrane protein